MKKKQMLSGLLVASMVFGAMETPVSAKQNEGTNGVLKVISSDQITCNANSEHSGAEISKAFDGNRGTFWDAAWETGDKGLNEKPIRVEVKFNTPKLIEKFVYTPRQDDNPNGMILEYSMTGKTQTGEDVILVENGVWNNDSTDKTVNMDEKNRLQSVLLEIKKGSLGNSESETAATAAEFSFYETVYEAKIDKDFLALTEGESSQVNLIDVAEGKVSWTSSNPEVASVSEDGTVTGVKEGTTTVTGITEKGEAAFCDVSVSATSAPVLPGKMLVFEDNFNGTELDTTKWNNWCVDLKTAEPFRYGNSPEVAVHPDNAYVKDGTLRLLGSKEDTTFDGQTSTYRSGMVQTRDKFEEKYGYVEAMVKIPNVPGSNPAVWTMPKADEENGGWIWGDKDNFGAEIDILERPHPEGAPEHGGLTEKYWITMHYDNYAYDLHKKFHYQPTIKNPYQWHKFGMEWTPEYINFMLDGEVVATQKNDVPNMDEIFILSYGLGGWIGKIADECLPAEMKVDYVRWYKNISDIDSSIALDSTEITLQEGMQQQLTASITPEGADSVVSWESSDATVASVDENGMVKAEKEGVAFVTAITQKKQSVTCKVIVKKEEKPDNGEGDNQPKPENPGNSDKPGNQDKPENPNKQNGNDQQNSVKPNSGGNQQKPGTSQNPKTGDSNTILVYLALVTGSTAVVAITLSKKRRKQLKK